MIVLRAAAPSDATATAVILNAFIQDTDWMPKLHTFDETVGFCERMIAGGWVHVAELDGSIEGFLSKNDGYVHALYVAEGAQNKGVGHRLLRNAQMQETALDLWTFQANTGAQRFYLREGFQEVERSDGQGNDEKLPDIRYHWKRGMQ